MRRHRAYPRDFVRCDGNPQASSADQERAVRVAREDGFPGTEGDMRVGSGVAGVARAEVCHGSDLRVGNEVRYDSLLENEAS